MKSHYINTDVDMESLGDLGRLKEFLRTRANLLYGERDEDGLWMIRIEADWPEEIGVGKHGAEQDIEELCELLKTAKTLFPGEFEALSRFDFNIGWQASDRRPEGAFTVNNRLVAEIAGMGASISVTVYPSDELE